MKNNLTSSIAEFVSAADQAHIPPSSMDMAQRAFIDLTGVMLAAGDEPVVRKLVEHTADSRGSCPVLLQRQHQRSASAAALINGTAAHALDYDDVQFNAHPSTVLVPALLAASALLPVSGARLLRAYVVGYEVWGELHSREPLAYHDKGWHPTSVLGTPAAAAAIAYLRGMGKLATQTVLSLAGSFTGGVVANFGAMSKSIHAGRAASAAVSAVEMADLGITAGEDGLGGLLLALSPRGGVNVAATHALGEKWFSVSRPLVFKKYPVCFATHRPLDAMLELVASNDIRPEEIDRVVVEIRATQAQLLRFDRPQTGLEAKFSMQFAAACALLRRRVTLADLADGFVTSPDMQALIKRVQLVERAAQHDGTPAIADRVVIHLRDGRSLGSGEIMAVQPHLNLREKFLDCCSAAGRSDGERLLQILERLQETDDLNQLVTEDLSERR